MIEQNIFNTSNLNIDAHPSLHESKDIHFLLNGDFTSHTNNEYNYFIQNIASNSKCWDFGKPLLGVIKLDADEFAIFTEDEIGIFNSINCTYVCWTNDSCLNFGTEVRGVYKYGLHGRIIYFIDDKNNLRYAQIDKPYPKKKLNECQDCDDKYSLRLDCEKLLVWKHVSFPNLNLTKGNGRIPSGKYQIAIAFNDNKLRLSDYFIYPNIFTISPIERSSLNLKFKCFKSDFTQYEIVLITHREDRGTVAQRIGYFETSQLDLSINEIDSPVYTPIDSKVLFSTKSYYSGFEEIAYNSSTTEGYLLLGGLKEKLSLNYWQQTFNIKAEWVEVRIPAKDSYKYPSALRDEVYSLEIAWIYKDGQISNRTHIPSLITPDSSWIEEVNNGDTWIDDCNSKKRKFFEIYNTAKITNCSLINKTKIINVCDYIVSAPNGPVQVQYTDINGITQRITITNDTTITAIEGTFNIYGFYQNIIGNYEGTYVEINCRTMVIDYTENSCIEEIPSDATICQYTIGSKGQFAYWESEIHYPSDKNFNTIQGDFRCKGIRHFKFPDNKISPHHITINGEEFVNILTIQFSNIERPKDCDGRYIEDISGYIIYCTDRSNQKSILHKGLLSNMWKEELADCSTSYYPNYPFNDLHPDVFLSKTLTHGDRRASFKPITDYSKSKFLYTSPDIDYVRNSTGEEITLYSEEWGNVSGSYHTTEEFPLIKFLSNSFFTALGELTIISFLAQIFLNLNFVGTGTNGGAGTSSFTLLLESYYNLLKGFLPYDNYAINYLSKGNYNQSSFNNIVQGNIRRQLKYSNYLLSSKQIQDGDKINANHREQGLYFKLNSDIIDPNVKEYSRIRSKDANCTDFDTNLIFNPATGQGENPKCSSYYVGVKVYRPAQYGNLNNSTGISKYYTQDLKDFNTTPLIFMGDVYITKHKKLRKFPFFTNIHASGYNDVGIIQSKIFNIWKPRFYMDYVNANPIFSAVEQFPGINAITALLTESPYNFEYGNDFAKVNCGDTIDCVPPTKGDEAISGGGFLQGRLFRNDGSVYTHAIGIQEYWCESEFIADYREINDITESNLNVDNTLLKKYKRIENPEISLYNLQYLWNGIQSNLLSADTKLNCCCIPNLDKERIIFSQANNIESNGDKWLSFLPNNYHQFTNFDGKLTTIHRIDEGNVLFAFENATYITQSDSGLLSNQGTVYIGEGSIFKRRLRKLSDDETGYSGSIDRDSFINTRYGVFWVDKKRKRFFSYDGKLNDITDGIRSWCNEFLLDVVNGEVQFNKIKGVWDNFTENIYWSTDKWTISYKPKNKNWNSFHSFLPDKYLQGSNNFLTIKGTSIWTHNKKYDYCNYYGVQYSFEIGFTINNKFKLLNLQSIELYSDFIEEKSYGEKIYTKKFFNRISAFSTKSSTGLLPLVNNIVEENTIDGLNKPKYTLLKEGTYRVNNFKNLAQSEPLIKINEMSYQYMNTAKFNEGNIMGHYFKIHLQSDYNLKTLVKLNLMVNSDNPQ